MPTHGAAQPNLPLRALRPPLYLQGWFPTTCEGREPPEQAKVERRGCRSRLGIFLSGILYRLWHSKELDAAAHVGTAFKPDTNIDELLKSCENLPTREEVYALIHSMTEEEKDALLNRHPEWIELIRIKDPQLVAAFYPLPQPLV